MSENENKQELNVEELDQVAGGNIIDDATYELTKLTYSIMTKVIQKSENDKMRRNNSAKIAKAAKENAVEKEPCFEMSPGGTMLRINKNNPGGTPPGQIY